MADDRPKKRKMVSVFDDRANGYVERPADPADKTFIEDIKEAFDSTSTSIDLRKARERAARR